MLRIKNILFLLPLVIGCSQPTESPEEFIEEVEECIHIGESDFSKDSILELADKITDHMKNQSVDKLILEEQIIRKEHELQEIKIHDQLSAEQILFLQNEERQLMHKIHEQQVMIEELQKVEPAPDPIEIIDTIIKPIYVYDTIHIQIEVIDTVKVKRKKRRNK